MKTSLFHWIKQHTYWLKWVLSLGVLAIVYSRVDGTEFWENVKNVQWWFYPAAIALALVNQSIGTFRWKLFLPEHSHLELFRLNMIGYFYAFALPSSITGDIAKVVHIDKKGKSTSAVIAGVFLDKITGLIALSLIALASIQLTDIDEFRNFTWPMAILAGGLISIYLLFYTRLYPLILSWILKTSLNRIKLLNNKLPQVGTLVNHIAELCKRKQMVLRSFLLAILFQCTILASYLLIDLLFPFNLRIVDYLIISGVTQLIMLLPLGIGGIGMKDVSFIVMLGLAGIPAEQALAASLIGYPAMLVLVLIGYVIAINSVGKLKSKAT